MFISSITLCGYKRLLSADIKYLHIDFTNEQQLLLGVNGSGKSSVLVELNPMPAIPQDYLKNGYKVITIIHGGQSYLLASYFDTAARHSFVINGLELNEGGTASVQKQLVLEYFNLDQDIVEVLSDQTRFHLFSPLERRNWLTRLSGSNMDFALGFFKYVKDTLRDTEAVIKYTGARLAKESGDIMSEESLEGLVEEALYLDEIILQMIDNKSSNHVDASIALEALRTLSDEALALSSNITATVFKNPYKSITSLSELQSMLFVKRQELSTHQTIKDNLYNEYSELKDALDIQAGLENEDLNTLVLQRTQLEQQIRLLQDQLQLYKSFDNASELYGATLAIKNSILNRVNELTDNSDAKFNREQITNKNNELVTINTKLNNYDFKLKELKVALDRMLVVEEVDCPSCNTRFKPGVDPNLVVTLEARIVNGQDEYDKLYLVKTEVEEYLAQARSYGLEYQALTNIMNESINLKPVWDEMKKVDLTTTSPHQLIDIFMHWELQITTQVNINKLILQMASIESTIDRLNAVQNNETTISKQRLATLSEAISHCINKIQTINKDIEQANNLELMHNKIYNGYLELKTLLDKRDEYKLKYMQDFSQSVLLQYMNELSAKKVKLNEQITAGQQVYDTIAALEQERDSYIAKRDMLKTILKELNPTDGLIAKQSKLFIEQFVEQINKVINAVWTYEMKVLPCPIESDKLTYKFPIYFSSTEASTSDISKSSAAQKAIIDFAFKLVVMAYLGLTDYPLYLDELGQSFDEKHRVNIMDFVKSLSSEYSQMFMISHYHNGHGIFTNAQITILDDSNLLTVPGSYNKHVDISNKMRAYKVKE